MKARFIIIPYIILAVIALIIAMIAEEYAEIIAINFFLILILCAYVYVASNEDDPYTEENSDNKPV